MDRCCFLLGIYIPILKPTRPKAYPASELNQSESIFTRARPGKSNPPIYDIRFFTPLAEEPLCGHGLVAAALTLRHLDTSLLHVIFHTSTGIAVAMSILPPASTTDPVSISMKFPAAPVLPTLALPFEVASRFAAALGVDEGNVVAWAQNEFRDIVVELHPSVDFSAAKMNIDPVEMLRASPPGTRSQVITAAARGEGVDFLKRVFAYGGEDQATGSTYCALAPYWAEKMGKDTLTCSQVSLRGGMARVTWDREVDVVEVVTGGVLVSEGEMLVPMALSSVVGSS